MKVYTAFVAGKRVKIKAGSADEARAKLLVLRPGAQTGDGMKGVNANA